MATASELAVVRKLTWNSFTDIHLRATCRTRACNGEATEGPKLEQATLRPQAGEHQKPSASKLGLQGSRDVSGAWRKDPTRGKMKQIQGFRGALHEPRIQTLIANTATGMHSTGIPRAPGMHARPPKTRSANERDVATLARARSDACLCLLRPCVLPGRTISRDAALGRNSYGCAKKRRNSLVPIGSSRIVQAILPRDIERSADENEQARRHAGLPPDFQRGMRKRGRNSVPPLGTFVLTRSP